jgi:hypothetical protein
MGQHLDSKRIKELEEEREKLTLEQKLKLMNELRNLEDEMNNNATNASILYNENQQAKKELPILEERYGDILKRYEDYKKAINNQNEINKNWENYYRLETRRLELFVLLDGVLNSER